MPRRSLPTSILSLTKKKIFCTTARRIRCSKLEKWAAARNLCAHSSPPEQDGMIKAFADFPMNLCQPRKHKWKILAPIVIQGSTGKAAWCKERWGWHCATHPRVFTSAYQVACLRPHVHVCDQTDFQEIHFSIRSYRTETGSLVATPQRGSEVIEGDQPVGGR